MQASLVRRLLLVALLAGASVSLSSGAGAQGILEATLTTGEREAKLRYAWRDAFIRIDRLDEVAPLPPFNLLDLSKGTLTICFPHNATRMTLRGGPSSPVADRSAPPTGPAVAAGPDLPASTAPRLDEVGGSHQPAGGPIDHGPPFLPGRLPKGKVGPDGPSPPEPPPGIGPTSVPHRTSRARPTPPALPQLSRQLRERIDRHAPGSLPPVPGLSPVPGDETDPAPGLSPTGRQRDLLGVSCREFTLADPQSGSLEVWASTELVPFSLLRHDGEGGPPRDGLREAWPALLRSRNLFPLLAILRTPDGETEILRFEVTRLDRSPDAAAPSLFRIPAHYREIPLPPSRFFHRPERPAP